MKIKPVVILFFLLIGFASAVAQVNDKENAEKKAEPNWSTPEGFLESRLSYFDSRLVARLRVIGHAH